LRSRETHGGIPGGSGPNITTSRPGLAHRHVPRYPGAMETTTAATETTPAIQDYLGAIYDLAGSDKPVIGARLARYMHLSAPSIAEALRRVRYDGFVGVEGREEFRRDIKGCD